MALLSKQLRDIAGKARASAGQEAGIGQAQNTMQVQQAVGSTPNTKAGAQQLAAASTQANQQVVNQANANQDAAIIQLGQQEVSQQAQAQKQKLQKKAQLDEDQITQLQRQGQMRQNSLALKQSKQLQDDELNSQERMTSAKIQMANEISFLTRKQRKDLAEMSTYVKQQVFDSRLSFEQDEQGRKFSNSRQLADYVVITAENEEDLANKMREINQAAKKELILLDSVNIALENAIKFQHQRAETKKDMEAVKHLMRLKEAAEKKAARKLAKASNQSQMLIGGGTIVGAVVGGVLGAKAGGVGAPQGAMAGAAVGKGAGTAAAGAAAK